MLIITCIHYGIITYCCTNRFLDVTMLYVSLIHLYLVFEQRNNKIK